MNRRLDPPAHSSRRRRLVIWAIVGVVVVGIVAGIGWFVVRPEVDLMAAEEALGRNDPVAARARLERCLARSSPGERALFLGAQAARRSDACADAERLLVAYEQAFRSTDASQLEWALLGAQQGDLAGYEDRLLSAVERNHPETPAILEALAKGYEAAYRWTDALTVLGRLLDRVPGHPPALQLRGTIQERLRRKDAAEEDLRRAVELAPASASAQAALAGLLNRLGHTREAIYHYELAL